MSYKKITLVSAAVASFAMINLAHADNVGNISVTASAPYVVNISDHAQDFRVDQDNYNRSDLPSPVPYNIWSNSPDTLTVDVVVDSGTTVLTHTAPGQSIDVHEQIPYSILYQPCNSGQGMEITGNQSFTIDHDKASKSACDLAPGNITVMRLPIQDANGNSVLPAAGNYTSNVTLTVREPVGGGVMIQ